MKKLFAIVTLIILYTGLPAKAQQRFIEGTHYSVISGNATAQKQIKEFFWYGCAHCYNIQPILENLRKSQPRDVAYIRVPAMWNKPMELHAKAYYTAKQLGVEDKVHQLLFDAMHLEKRRLSNANEISQIFTHQGVTNTAFNKTINAFGINAQMLQANKEARASGVSYLPTIIINGKFKILNSAQSAQTLPSLITFLLNKQ